MRSANPAFYEVFQTEPEQTIGTLIFNLGNGQWNIPKLRQVIQEILPHGDEVRDFEVEHTFESIGHRTMLLNAKRVSLAETQEEEQEDLILLAIEDVTPRKKAELATSAAKKYAENIVATVREPLLVLGTDLRVRSANPAFYDVFQTVPDQTIGTLIFNLGNGQWNIPKLRQVIQEILPHGDEVRDFEVEHTFKSIGHRTMLLNAKRVSLAKEQAEEQEELILLAIEDVTPRKKAELASSAAKKYAENIVATVREPLLVLGTDLRVRSANPAFYNVFQTVPDQTIGTVIFDLGNGQWNIPKLREVIQEILPGGEELRDFEVEHTFKSIGHRTMRLNAKRVSLANEQAEEQEDLILLAIEDVTRRKEAEAAVRDLTRSLESRVRTRTTELEEANRVLSHANESLDAFTYVVGHDLKEPTRAVETILTILEEDYSADVPETVRALHAKARAANRRLASLVTGLLEFSRASRADLTDAQPVSVDDALRMDDCTTRFRDRIAERGARLEYPGHDFLVHVHVPGLCQILGNLVQNAVKHNPKAEPLVRVKAQRAADEKMVEVIVEDNGPGFPPDVIAGIERMRTATRGFGLAIAKRVVERTGGKLWLGRSPEGGGAVHFTLPARARTADTPRETPPADPKTFSEHAAELGAEQRVRDREGAW